MDSKHSNSDESETDYSEEDKNNYSSKGTEDYEETQHDEYLSQLNPFSFHSEKYGSDHNTTSAAESGEESSRNQSDGRVTVDIKPRKLISLSPQLFVRGISNVHIDKRMDRGQILNCFEKVTHLHLQRKRIDILTSFEQFKSLTHLYLYENRICEVVGLEQASQLELLDLHENLIDRINGLINCRRLEKLYLGQNRISIVEGLEQAYNLQELHIEYQNIPYGESLLFDPITLDSLSKSLKILDVSGTGLETIEDLAGLENLVTLFAKDNRLAQLDQTTLVITTMPGLRKIDFRGNPMCKMGKYREKMIGYATRIEYLDGKDISPITRDAIKRFWNMKTNRLKQLVEQSYANQQYYDGDDNLIAGSNHNGGQYYGDVDSTSTMMMKERNGNGIGTRTKTAPIRSQQIPVAKYDDGSSRRRVYSSPAIANNPAALTNSRVQSSGTRRRASASYFQFPTQSMRSMPPESGLSIRERAMSESAINSDSPFSSSRSSNSNNDQSPIPQFILATQKFLRQEQHVGQRSSSSSSSSSAAGSSYGRPTTEMLSSTSGGGTSRKWTTVLSPIPAGETEDESATSIASEQQPPTTVDGKTEAGQVERNETGDEGDDDCSQASTIRETEMQNQLQNEYNNSRELSTAVEVIEQEQPQYEANVYHLPPWPHIKRLGARQPIITFIP